MRTIIHDFESNDLKKINFNEEDMVISAREITEGCVGCFSCWVKHPKECIHDDNIKNIVDSIKNSDELVIISKCRYGCYSAYVKKVLERCIGYVLPYFTIRENRIHHKSRYDERIIFNTYFYGDIDNWDKICLRALVKANAINLNAFDYRVNFISSLKELNECIH